MRCLYIARQSLGGGPETTISHECSIIGITELRHSVVLILFRP